LVVDNYVGLEADKLLKIAIEQNVLTQIKNLENPSQTTQWAIESPCLDLRN